MVQTGAASSRDNGRPARADARTVYRALPVISPRALFIAASTIYDMEMQKARAGRIIEAEVRKASRGRAREIDCAAGRISCLTGRDAAAAGRPS